VVLLILTLRARGSVGDGIGFNTDGPLNEMVAVDDKIDCYLLLLVYRKLLSAGEGK
jgi:hypothetical protein